MLAGSVVTVASVSIALQIVLPQIWSGFTVFSDSTQNAVFLGCCAIAVTTIINIVIFVAAIGIVGGAYYLWRQHGREHSVAHEHRAERQSDAVIATTADNNAPDDRDEQETIA